MNGGVVRGVETIMVTGLLFVEGAAGLNKFLKIKADKMSSYSKGLCQKFHHQLLEPLVLWRDFFVDPLAMNFFPKGKL